MKDHRRIFVFCAVGYSQAKHLLIPRFVTALLSMLILITLIFLQALCKSKRVRYFSMNL
jgi:hypothetical protein